LGNRKKCRILISLDPILADRGPLYAPIPTRVLHLSLGNKPIEGAEDGAGRGAFASKLQRVFLFGCRKDDATLDQMLPPEVFDGKPIEGAEDGAGRGAFSLENRGNWRS